MAVASLIEESAFEVMAVGAELTRVRTCGRYYGAGDLLLKALQDTVECIVKDLGALADRYSAPLSQNDQDSVLSKARRYAELAGVLHGIVGLIEGSDEDGAPSSLVEPAESLARCYSDRCNLLLRASHEGDTRGYWWQCWIPEFVRILGGSRIPGTESIARRIAHVVTLTVPAAGRGNVLLHSVLGHELGHHFIYEDETAESIVVPRGSPRPEPTPSEARQPTIFDTMVKNWVVELLADGWGLHMMGPAYYFACQGLADDSPGDQDHPPDMLRLDWLREQLRCRGYDNVQGPYGQWLNGEVAAHRSVDRPGASGDVGGHVTDAVAALTNVKRLFQNPPWRKFQQMNMQPITRKAR